MFAIVRYASCNTSKQTIMNYYPQSTYQGLSICSLGPDQGLSICSLGPRPQATLYVNMPVVTMWDRHG